MSLVGDKLNGQQINIQVESLVKEVSKNLEEIKGIKPSTAENTDSFNSMLAAIKETRGRELFYPYIGSGAGRGVFVELADGSVKMDLINGIGIHLMGHSHPRLMAAMIRASLKDIVNQGNLQPNGEYLQISQKLTQLAQKNSRLQHVWLSTCGSMANENALKICRQKKSPARKVIAMKDAFAGRTTMMAEITDNPAYKKGLPEYNEVLRVPFATTYSTRNCEVACRTGCRVANESEAVIQLLKKYIDENRGDISCFSFEPMLGEGGYRVACTDFFVPILRYLREQEVPIWADEVQTFGRTGELFAFEKLGIGEFVDVCTIAKPAQIGATLYTKNMNPEPGLIAGTFSGSTAALAAGLETLNILTEQNFLGPKGRIEQIHNQFMEVFENLRNGTLKGMLKDPGGLGLMISVTPFNGDKDVTTKVMHRLFQNGVMTFGCGKMPFRLRFLVPAIIADEEIQLFSKIFEKTMLEMAKEIDWVS